MMAEIKALIGVPISRSPCGILKTLYSNDNECLAQRILSIGPKSYAE